MASYQQQKQIESSFSGINSPAIRGSDTDEVAVVTHLAFKEVLTFSCILKHEDFEMKTN